MRTCWTFLLLFLAHAAGYAESVHLQVSASADDAHAYGSSGLLTTFSYPRFGQNGNLEPYESAVRFVDLPIDAGAEIDSAFLEFRAHTSWSSDSIVYRVVAEDTADASAFSDRADYDLRLGNLMAPSGTQTIPGTTAGDWYRTPDLSDMLEALLDRADWRKDSSDIALFLRPTQDSPEDVWFEMYHFDADSVSAHRLHIYTGSGETTPILKRRRRAVLLSSPSGGN